MHPDPADGHSAEPYRPNARLLAVLLSGVTGTFYCTSWAPWVRLIATAWVVLIIIVVLRVQSLPWQF